MRQLTPAEGLALVCLTSWVEPETGLARASDRQVCHQTGVSRDVMKRLRRKLLAIGLEVTPGSNLSHDSCSYDFRKVLDVETSRQLRASPERAATIPRMLRASSLPGKERVDSVTGRDELGGGMPGAEPVEKAPSLGANGTEGGGAKSAEPGAEEPSSIELEPYAFMSVSKERAPNEGVAAEPDPAVGSGRVVASRDQGATPQGELASLPPTAPVWPPDLAFTGDLSQPLNFWDDYLKREVEARKVQLGVGPEAPSPPPLPPYEQWLARR